jgi:ABC-type molybdate transport system substrate-binding protein
MVSRTRQAAVAARFLVFLAGPEGQAILKRFGFEPASR